MGHYTPTILILQDANSAAQKVADMMQQAIEEKPNLVLGLATGGTPVATYRELVRRHEKEDLDFARVRSFNLDEYVGLSSDHPQSYRVFMRQQLFDHINIDPENTYVPDGLADDVTNHAQQYESLIASEGGIDLQLLGIGQNGHIAFNEPGSAGDSRTREIELTQRTIDSNSRFFESASDVPRTAITMGIGTILEAKSIVLLATGESKAQAIRKLMADDPHEQNPASYLKTHPNVTIVLDHDAAASMV